MRFAAIGDSFTEGVGDPLADGTMRGWADLVAAGLAGAGRDVHYANLAIRGRLLETIATEQCDAALALDPPPDVLTFNGGGNDMMRPGWDPARVEDLVSRVVDLAGQAGVRLVLLSGPDPTARLPRGRVFARRADDLMEICTRLAQPPHVSFVDNYSDGEMRHGAYWSADRLHLNPLGHARVAARMLDHLGVPTVLPDRGDLAEPPRSVAGEAAYMGRYVLPWLGRRVTRRSSGDGRPPKAPAWVAVSAA
ncbi:SGNH/GDSL hydrolase family protein [Demequina pelophila]|uniref:SGNH/GDSL hydrolase family protein n=1 Tax=Demequina pelophila TaxID=1638984 RepID=UPI0007830FE7|nr:SGNH/GDSL hydrolase family protein [Demequina pelophila]